MINFDEVCPVCLGIAFPRSMEHGMGYHVRLDQAACFPAHDNDLGDLQLDEVISASL